MSYLVWINALLCELITSSVFHLLQHLSSYILISIHFSISELLRNEQCHFYFYILKTFWTVHSTYKVTSNHLRCNCNPRTLFLMAYWYVHCNWNPRNACLHYRRSLSHSLLNSPHQAFAFTTVLQLHCWGTNDFILLNSIVSCQSSDQSETSETIDHPLFLYMLLSGELILLIFLLFDASFQSCLLVPPLHQTP